MQRWPMFLALGALLLIAAPVFASPEEGGAEEGGAEEGGAEARTIPLEYKAYRKWKLELPAERFRPVTATLELAGAKAPFAMKVEGEALAVDTDADGEADVKVEGEVGFVALKTAGDTPYRYAMRLAKGPAGWAYAPGCARVGTLDDVKVQLIDQDGNGSYADIGTDAMIVGSSKAASFLSRVVNVAGRLYTIDVVKDGTAITFTPYTGTSGVLDLITAHESKAKVMTVLVKSADGAHCFDLARASEGLRVPAGTYQLLGGRLGLGSARVSFVTGRAESIAVAADATTQVAWGGPLRAEYRYALTGGEVGFSPDQVWYFGKAGEQYTVWSPFGKSPEFSLVSRKTRDEIAKAIFTGC